MYTIVATNRFKKNFKLCLKRGLKEDKLKQVVSLLAEKGSLPAKYKPHILKGKYTGLWEVPHTTRLATCLGTKRHY